MNIDETHDGDLNARSLRPKKLCLNQNLDQVYRIKYIGTGCCLLVDWRRSLKSRDSLYLLYRHCSLRHNNCHQLRGFIYKELLLTVLVLSVAVRDVSAKSQLAVLAKLLKFSASHSA